MNAPARTDVFQRANPHALATILEASETKRIIASRDIFDLSGIKLWARDQPVSSALQRKLMDRQLRNPLETCLMAEDGVTPLALLRATETLLEADTPLAALLAPHARRVAEQVPHLPLHSVAQLLLTAGQASRPESFDHAVQAMALAGAMMAGHGGNTGEIRLAMLAGLLHDLGEMYIDPRFGEADADRGLDFLAYQQLVVHPHVGQLLLAQLTNYPAAVARAVAEHHERLDGSGYPHALRRDAISPLGRLLAVAEAALAVLRGDQPSLARASVALRVVPGEFDFVWVGRVAEGVRGQPALPARLSQEDLEDRLARLDSGLQAAQQHAVQALPQGASPRLQDALGLAQHLLGRLRAGFNASGLWCPQALAEQDLAEVEAVEDELFFRLRAIERAVLLRAGKLTPPEGAALERFCASLKTIGR